MVGQLDLSIPTIRKRRKKLTCVGKEAVVSHMGRPKRGVLLIACAFNLAHSDSVRDMVAALILGIINAAAYERTKSLWLSILIHFFTNRMVVLILFASMVMSK